MTLLGPWPACLLFSLPLAMPHPTLLHCLIPASALFRALEGASHFSSVRAPAPALLFAPNVTGILFGETNNLGIEFI